MSLGAWAEFRVVAVGSPPLRYQWRHEGELVALATNSALTLAEVQLEDGGDYDVVITNDYGELTSRTALLTVDPMFTKITNDPLVAEAVITTGLTWLDWNNDGLLDVLFANGESGRPMPNTMFGNNGDGSFTKVDNALTSIPGASWGAPVADYNNDGWEDLFVLNPLGAANQLFRNASGLDFVEVDAEEAGPLVTDRRIWASAGRRIHRGLRLGRL